MKAATINVGHNQSSESISIHAAREGGDCREQILKNGTKISIHAAREGGDDFYPTPSKLAGISIHAAREGGDTAVGETYAIMGIFQSTPPVKAATRFQTAGGFRTQISIHAAREGGDAARRSCPTVVLYFNPRRP